MMDPLRKLSPLVAILLTASCLDGQALQTAPQPAYRPGVDVLRYDNTIHLPTEGRSITAVSVLTVLRTGPVDTLVLDLNRLRVTSVTLDGEEVRHVRTPEILAIPLPPGEGDTLVVSVSYEGEVTDGLIIRTGSAGKLTAFGDNWPNRARFWFPSVDHPSDKAAVSWTVHAPPGTAVVANGRLDGEPQLRIREDPTHRVWRWREDQPIPTYTMVIGVGPLVRHDLEEAACGLAELQQCVSQSVWTAPEEADYMPGPFEAAPRIVDWMARLIGPYPYEKLDHIQSSTRFGGMENSGAIFYDERAFKERRVGEGLLAHEIAHQWFGNSVTVREWTHLWLSEGFATYFDALWTEHARGVGAFRSKMSDTRQRILRDTGAVPNRPVLDSLERDPMRLLNANSYQKGGWILHMLRHQVGDSAFFRGVRSYYAQHRHANAASDDLQAAVEEAAGQRLGWFFDQWLRRPGYPEIGFSWSYDDTSRLVTVTVEQSERFGQFSFPLMLAVSEPSGATRMIRIDVPARRSTTLRLPVEFAARPVAVTPDPEVALLARIEARSP
jgi:aminopeptidase N